MLTMSIYGPMLPLSTSCDKILSMTKNRAASTDAGSAYHHGDLKRALVSAALTLLTEKQDWDFSLREVTRVAGVSHNAPYNHFVDKRDLLAAVAAASHEVLLARMQAAATSVDARDAAGALAAIGEAYVHFGTENPARYRLMFGTALVTSENDLPPIVAESAARAKTVLRDIVLRGALDGTFAVSPADAEAMDLAVLSAWSIVHGLTMLLIDGLAATGAPLRLSKETVQQIAEGISRTFRDGMLKR